MKAKPTATPMTTKAGDEKSGSMSSQDAPTTMAEVWQGYWRATSPRILITLLLSFLAARSLLGPLGAGDLLAIVLPLLIWPLLEWALHRYALHLPPMTLLGKSFHFEFARRHQAHHRQPWRTELIFLPTPVHLLLAPSLTAGLWLLLQDWRWVSSFMAALILMTMIYEWVHFIVHTRLQPQSRYAQQLFRNHRMHHFRNEHYWFSFTVPMLDRWFGTGPNYRTTRRSPTCQDIHGSEAVDCTK